MNTSAEERKVADILTKKWPKLVWRVHQAPGADRIEVRIEICLLDPDLFDDDLDAQEGIREFLHEVEQKLKEKGVKVL